MGRPVTCARVTGIAFRLLAGAMFGMALLPSRAPAEDYLFTYFVGNGADGLHLAASEDGYHWVALSGGRSVLTPAVGPDRLMRDPCVTQGPDGTFHLVWTSGWWDHGIGHASTRDFITWSKQDDLPVMTHEPGVRNTWAPEVIWDALRQHYLIFWSSTVRGKFPETAGASEDDLNHRIYCTTTRDWVSFTPTRLFCDPGFSVIDATLLTGPDGRPRLIAKDETLNPPRKHLRLADAADTEGPWTTFGRAFTRDWVEGPTAISVGDETVVYFDVYREHRYGAVRSRDLVSWADVSARIAVPAGARHGTMIRAPRSVVDGLRASSERTAGVLPGPDPANSPTTETPLDSALPTIFVAGDSTAEKPLNARQAGWGGPFRAYFDPAKVNVANRAIGGRSSRTFVTDGRWDRLLAEAKAGDFVLIQFGHNDAGATNAEPPGSTRPLRARGTLPGLGEETEEIDNVLTKKHEIVHTFGWYLRKMIAEARARGVNPILLSPTVRNIWSDGKVERGPGQYREWSRAIAQAAGVSFVDVSGLIADRYERLGPERVKEYFPVDHTHTNPDGADFNARVVVVGLQTLGPTPWAEALSALGREAVAPATAPATPARADSR